MAWENDDYRSSEYPRKGKYGDTTPRCAWCGKPVDFGTRCCIGGACYRYYCSYSCRAAGDFYINGVLSGCVLIFSIAFYIWMMQIVPSYLVFSGFLGLFLLMFLCCSLPTWSCFALGYNERKKEHKRESNWDY